jgi:hypothetical protein
MTASQDVLHKTNVTVVWGEAILVSFQLRIPQDHETTASQRVPRPSVGDKDSVGPLVAFLPTDMQTGKSGTLPEI